jgi:hypothetical protein
MIRKEYRGISVSVENWKLLDKLRQKYPDRNRYESFEMMFSRLLKTPELKGLIEEEIKRGKK